MSPITSFNTPAHDMIEYVRGLSETDKRLREVIVAWLYHLGTAKGKVKHALHEHPVLWPINLR